MTKISAKIQNLIGCGVIIALLLIGTTVYVLWSAYSFVRSINSFNEKSLPSELIEPRILTGNGFFTRTELFKLDKNEHIKTIGKSINVKDEKERQKLIGSETAKTIYGFSDLDLCGNEIIAAGEFGAYVFNLEGELKREILFEPTIKKIRIGWYEQNSYEQNLTNLKIVELKKGEACGFISFDMSAGVTVYNDQGNIIWNYGKRDVEVSGIWIKDKDVNAEKEKYVLRAAAGDLDNDGIVEFVVSQNNDGIRAFKYDGAEIWFQADKFAYNRFLIVDFENNLNQLLEYGSNSKIRDKSGNVIKSFRGSENYLISNQPDGNKQIQFVDLNDNKLIVKNANGENILQAEAPLSEIKLDVPRKIEIPFDSENSYIDDSENVYHPKSVWFNLQKGKPQYLAVIGKFIGLPRSQFYVYDEKGNLVYQEILPENAETIAVLPNQDGMDNILIAGKDTIWKFSAN